MMMVIGLVLFTIGVIMVAKWPPDHRKGQRPTWRHLFIFPFWIGAGCMLYSVLALIWRNLP